MTTGLYWFRNDLRVTDNPALAEACASCDRLSLVYVVTPRETQATPWGFPRWGLHRRSFRDQALQGLDAELSRRGARLRVLTGPVAQVIPEHAHTIGADRVHCETVAAPEETAELGGLRDAGLAVHERWQSSLLEPEDLPFGVEETPEVFTTFRRRIEEAQRVPRPPCLAPSMFPPTAGSALDPPPAVVPVPAAPAEQSSFPFDDPAYRGSESAALSHLARYFGSTAPQTYKATRNGLIGPGYSTKLSPWLALGALSARSVYQHLKAHETQFGANDGTYWIWFELLWRDFFRLWCLKHGRTVYRARGLHGDLPRHDPAAFRRWCSGNTGHPFVDAGMRELAHTGYLSNRMRQVVASHLVHDLGCDWRAGAAWFEARLIDYDVYSNQGNWLYVAGRGADPRQGRRFNIDKQADSYDPDGAYQALWRDAGRALVP